MDSVTGDIALEMTIQLEHKGYGLDAVLFQKLRNFPLDCLGVSAHVIGFISRCLFARTGGKSPTVAPVAPDRRALWRAGKIVYHDPVENYAPDKYSGSLILFRSATSLEAIPGDPACR